MDIVMNKFWKSLNICKGQYHMNSLDTSINNFLDLKVGIFTISKISDQFRFINCDHMKPCLLLQGDALSNF